MEGGSQRLLSTQGVASFREGIELLLSQWSALQLAVENEWGGRDSRRKSDLLRSDVFSWFTQCKEPLYIDDLENILDDALLSLNTVGDDGSIEEVAEKLMIMHEDCLNSDFTSIENLRLGSSQRITRSHVRQVNEWEESDTDSIEEDRENNAEKNDNASGMAVDLPESQTNSNEVNMQVDEPRSKSATEVENGWVKVTSRRNKGKRN